MNFDKEDIKTAGRIVEDMNNCDEGLILTDGSHYHSKWLSINDNLEANLNELVELCDENKHEGVIQNRIMELRAFIFPE